MSVHLISAQDAIARMLKPQGFSTIIDARSEDEYALDHLPNAVNWPSLNNQERPQAQAKRGCCTRCTNLAPKCSTLKI